MKRGQDQQPVPAQQGLADLETAEGESFLHKPGTPPPRRLALSPPRRSGRNGGSGNPCRTLGAPTVVAQSCTLLYRGFAMCRRRSKPDAPVHHAEKRQRTAALQDAGANLAARRPPQGFGVRQSSAAFGPRFHRPPHLRFFAPSRLRCSHLLAHLLTCSLAHWLTGWLQDAGATPAARRPPQGFGVRQSSAAFGPRFHRPPHLRFFAPSRLRCSHLPAFWPTGSLAF